MSEDQFTKLFKYIEEFRKDVDKRFDEVDARFDKLTNSIDNFVKRLDSNEIEQASRDRQFKQSCIVLLMK